MQWLQYSKQNNVENLKNVRREPSTHFRNKKEKYLLSKIDELETNIKYKKCTRIV